MKNEAYKNYILDQLRDLDIDTRKMFGSFGFYLEGNFFAIISNNRLYFKTNEKTSKKYKEFNMEPFKPSEKQILKNYYEVPSDIIENQESLRDWALEASFIKKNK